MLTLLLLVISLFASVQGFTTCTEQARSLRSDRMNVALTRGLLWPDQASINASSSPVNNFHLCMQISDGPYLHVQLDTGSTGIVVNKHSIGTVSEISTVCQSFLYDSSDNAYWGSMVKRPVTLFGGDSDGRYLRVGPLNDIRVSEGMPVLSVEYVCKGADCLSVLNGNRPSTTDCDYVRQRLTNNRTVSEKWREITVDDGVAMLGVGYDRGAPAEGYTAPVPLSRNAALRINASSLKSVVISQNTTSASLPCASNIDATGYSACADLGACDQPNYQYKCRADSADPQFTMGSATDYYSIGYVITRSRFIPLIAPPSNSQQLNGKVINPVSQAQQFSCVSLPAFPVDPINGQPGFTCHNANAVQGQNELRPIDTGLGNVVYAAHGTLLPDTGIQYEIFEPRPKPLLDAPNQLITFRFPVLPNQPANVNCSINPNNSDSVCTTQNWSFIAHLGDEVRINGTGGYYPTSEYSPYQQSPPTYVRFINNTAVAIPADQALNQSMFVNTGRFLMTDFMYYVNLQAGVIGFAPLIDVDSLPDTVQETGTNEANTVKQSSLIMLSTMLLLLLCFV